MTTGVACPHCGSPIEPGQQFCKSCGMNISGVQGDVATRQVRVESSMTAQLQRGIRDALQEATLGDYEILAELGRGGMATVFLAHDIQLDRKVAIKVMSPALLEGEGMIERFKLEARTAAGLSHPHIIPIYAVRETDELLYFVMKFIEGRALDSIIDTAAPLPVPLVQNVITKVAEALGYAHRQGVVHRDIKPANIMIDTEGTPIVTDFGIAKVASKQGLTMTGATIGTPTYMSPEQCNAGQITGSSDQYSLGCVAYEMLTGHPPFDGDSVLTIMFKHVSEPAPAPESLGADCPPELAAAVRKMLAKKPEDRFPTIEAAAAAIGGTALAYDDPIRTQMVDFANEGAALQVLKRVSTPRSPIPVARTRQGTSPSAKTVRMSTGETTGGHAAKPKRRRGLWIGVSVIVLAAAAVAVWLKPWVGMGTAAQPTQPDTAAIVAATQTPPAEPPTTRVDSQPSVPATPVQQAPAASVETQKPAPKP
ncbi:MAG TPA: protein kinase, partial [Gemmatimonadales bacterium]|nr:protein kinase [Gemmatimonadales bacterium]